MTVTVNPLAEIERLDKLLDINRAMLHDKNDPPEYPEKLRARIDELLDERVKWMKLRDTALAAL